jgi:murein L,D-transpeptidase YcbB/YkuD
MEIVSKTNPEFCSSPTLASFVPVHLIYRTAVTKPTGGMTYRRDIYGRDAKILAALVGKGVVITPLAR